MPTSPRAALGEFDPLPLCISRQGLLAFILCEGKSHPSGFADERINNGMNSVPLLRTVKL